MVRVTRPARRQAALWYRRATWPTIVREVASIAAERGVSRAQVALAWVSRNPVVSAPIVGVTKRRGPHPAGRCSSPPTTSAISRSPTPSTTPWRPRTAPGSSRSVPAAICARPSCSTTSTSPSASTTVAHRRAVQDRQCALRRRRDPALGRRRDRRERAALGRDLDKSGPPPARGRARGPAHGPDGRVQDPGAKSRDVCVRGNVAPARRCRRGRYFEDCNQAVPYEGGPERVGVADYALDPEAAQRLWDLSADAISN